VILKSKYKKWIQSSAWLLVLSGLIFSLGFVSKKEREIVAKTISIDILNNEENLFLNESEIKAFVQQREKPVLGQKYAQLDIPKLEKVLNAHPAIENAEVAATLNGEVKLEVTQRTPLVRVINKNGESYYIDKQSKLMPLNENYSSRVIIANGEIFEPYDRRSQFSVDQISNNKSFSEVSILDDVLAITRYIQSDSLLNDLIHQIYVNKDQELEVFPVFGCQKIIFGKAERLDEKFNKLKLFYKQGINKTDGWNKYASLNLKYKNMVVCTKK
jgi:cell division protein FtsQ